MRISPKIMMMFAPAALLGCGDEGGDGSSGSETRTEAVATYADIVSANYEDTLAAAKELNESLEALVDDPSESSLEAAKDAWLAAREPYLQTEVYRFYDGPIDNPDDGPEGQINAWPMDESHVDYVTDDGVVDATGIVNGDAKITEALLLSANEQGGEKNIATGYHPIEFLLWGQDKRDDGPGERPYTDYVTGTGGTAANQARRGQYLLTAGNLLVDNLTQVNDAWVEGEANYRAEFEADDPTVAIQKILTGMLVLSGFETGGERLQAAMDSGDQEDEHSCFSDNTHRDMVGDVVGVQNVYLGRYTRADGSEVEGTGVYDVVAEADEELANELRDQIAESVELAEALKPPFDQEIAAGNTEGRARVQALIDALYAQEALLGEVFDALDLTVEVPE